MKPHAKKTGGKLVSFPGWFERPVATFIIGFIVILTFYSIYQAYFPSIRNTIGHDYAYFLPHLLDGFFWYSNNGLSEVPWFTPSYGGGLPNFPNPQSIYYSIPQFISFLVDPLSSIKTTLLLFGTAGFAGCYILLKDIFNFKKSTSLLGATIFLFNGFFAHRMQVGHITYHSFMLFPYLYYVILNNCTHDKRVHPMPFVMENVIGGLILAYMIYSGSFYIIPPVYLALAVCTILYLLYVNGQLNTRMFLAKTVLTALVGLLLAASKLNASLSYLSLFPRDLYPLPGIDDFFNLISLCFNCLFSIPDADFANKVTVNKVFMLERHEYEFGVGIAAFLLVLTGSAYFIFKRLFMPAEKISVKNRILIAICFSLSAIPLLLNYYTPGYNLVLKSIPFIKNTSTNIRWFCTYIPILVLISCLTIEKIRFLSVNSTVVCISGILLTLLTSVSLDMKFYKNQPYDPLVITNAYHELISGSVKPEIRTICIQSSDTIGNSIYPVSGNGTFIAGCSVIFPYEPLFGYRLENFPRKQLVEGPVMMELPGGFLNIKNPSSYVFPDENKCKPGDHFKTSQKSEAEKFVNYRPFKFQMSERQHLANSITLVSLALCSLFSVLFASWKTLGKTAGH